MASARLALHRGTWIVLAAAFATAASTCTRPNPRFGGAVSHADAADAPAAGDADGSRGQDVLATDVLEEPALGGGIDGSPDTVVPLDLAMGKPPAACGNINIDLGKIQGARGLAIEIDGTVYFTRENGTQSWIGRLRPTGTAEPSWFALPTNAQPRTIRVDSARRRLFVAAFNLNAVYVVSLDTGTLAATLPGLTAPHGIAVTNDGAILISTGDGHIQHMLPSLGAAERTQATDAAVFPSGQRPLGLAINHNGRLFAGSSNGGIKHYRIEHGQLVEPTPFGTFVGTANDLVFDVKGTLYVADFVGTAARPLTQIASNGTTMTQVAQVSGRLSSLAFGRGALRCDDLHIGDAMAVTHRWTAPQPGLDLP